MGDMLGTSKDMPSQPRNQLRRDAVNTAARTAVADDDCLKSGSTAASKSAAQVNAHNDAVASLRSQNPNARPAATSKSLDGR